MSPVRRCVKAPHRLHTLRRQIAGRWLLQIALWEVIVTCRDLPQLITQGDTIDKALWQAHDAMAEVFAAYVINSLRFPVSSKRKSSEHLVAPPIETVEKAALFMAMLEFGVSKVKLAKPLGVDEKEVRRLFDPLHKSKLPRIAEAVSSLGMKLVIGLEPPKQVSKLI